MWGPACPLQTAVAALMQAPRQPYQPVGPPPVAWGHWQAAASGHPGSESLSMDPEGVPAVPTAAKSEPRASPRPGHCRTAATPLAAACARARRLPVESPRGPPLAFRTWTSMHSRGCVHTAAYGQSVPAWRGPFAFVKGLSSSAGTVTAQGTLVAHPIRRSPNADMRSSSMWPCSTGAPAGIRQVCGNRCAMVHSLWMCTSVQPPEQRSNVRACSAQVGSQQKSHAQQCWGCKHRE